MSVSSRRRVALVCYACHPHRGSEHGVGWAWARELSKYLDTWVICKDKDGDGSLRGILEAKGSLPGLRLHHVPRSRLERAIKSVPVLRNLAYSLWQRRAFRELAALHAQVGFDLAHQITFCSFREPGYLHRLGIPFVWGPIGGVQNYPWRFLSRAGVQGCLREGLRSLVNLAQFRYAPRVRKAVRSAAALVAANSLTRRRLSRVHRVEAVQLLDVGTDALRAVSRPERGRDSALRVLWVGVLEHHKALHLLLGALAQVQAMNFQLRVVGDGHLRSRWRRLARVAGIEARCEWIGWLPHESLWEHYRWADVFVFTSLRDTCGSVILEAMSAGAPVVCLDHQGAGDVVTAECGLKIPVSAPAEVIQRLSEILWRLSEDRARLAQLSAGALGRSREFLWAVKAQSMLRIYESALALEPGSLSGAKAVGHEAARGASVA